MTGHHPIAYLNGEFIPLEQACIPVLDRGFLLGDGVYEVIPVYGGRLFRLGPHLNRLDHSLHQVRIPNPFDLAGWSSLLEELTERNGSGDQSVYLQVTRGVANKRDHSFAQDMQPTVLAMSSPLTPPDEAVAEMGVGAITLDDIRWKRCDIKAITLLPNVLLRQQALDAGAAEAILLNEGHATEGAASNLFIVIDNRLITPPKGPQLLPGITRDLTLELAEADGVACEQRAIAEDELRAADEIWLTSSTKEILPVTTLDGSPVGHGVPGPLWQRMRGIYQQYKAELRAGTQS